VFDRQRQAATEGDDSLAGTVTRLAQTRPLRAVAQPAGCWWQDVDTPQDARQPRRRCAARWARTLTGPSAAGSTDLCRPGCRCSWPRCGPLAPPELEPGHLPIDPVGDRAREHQQPAGQAERERDQRYEVGRGPQGALLDGLLDRVGDAAILAGLGLWALDGRAPEGVLVWTVAATTGALLSMAGGCCWLPWGAVLGAPVAALAAITAPRRFRLAYGSPSSAGSRRRLLELAGQAGRCLRGYT
jgi:hypothetical protein